VQQALEQVIASFSEPQ